MSLSRIGTCIAFVGVFLVSALAYAGQMPQMPTPGPEHQVLKMDEGTWDAVIEGTPAPGAPPMTSKGTEVDRIGCGGLCLISDFKGEIMPGMTFEGHGVSTWDPAKKKYVGSWVDSISQGLAVSEATWDAAAKRMSGWMEGPDMTGKVVKMTSTGEYRDNGNTRVMTMFVPGPDGKDMQVMRITYTRRK
jgi:hypothetical protein